MTPDLPPDLRQAVDRLMEGRGRKDLSARAQKISDTYRAGGGSAAVIREADDALAYALTRLPATYAACARAFHEAGLKCPEFSPRSLLDAGAGPGGASWAALAQWPDLDQIVLLDSNPTFLNLSRDLSAGRSVRLEAAERLTRDLARPRDWPDADLVMASYALAELPQDRLAEAVIGLWEACRGLMIIIEPGSPEGSRRMLSARDTLIQAGASILAPCPHGMACPVHAPDWCHFVQRLPRSRDHRLAKGGDAPFEDEKFIYLVVGRSDLMSSPPQARILAPAQHSKPGVRLKLCTPEGQLEMRDIPKRDKSGYRDARRRDWGDSL